MAYTRILIDHAIVEALVDKGEHDGHDDDDADYKQKGQVNRQ